MTPSRKCWPRSPPATPAAGPGRLADFFVNPLVGHQPIGIDRAGGRATHGAARLGQMAAIVEAALIEVRPEFRKAAAERIGVDAPRADLSQTGGVDDVADARDRHELRCGGGVLPGPPFLADRADPQLEAGLEGVEQARFPRARCAGK